MKTSLTALIVLCTVFSLRAQSLFSVLHLNEETTVHSGVPKQIVEVRTFYNSNGVEIKQDITEYDSLGLPTSLQVLDERKQVVSIATFKHDKVRRVVLEKSLNQLNVRFPSNKVRTTYEYDTLGHLLKIAYYNQEGTVVKEVHLKNNAIGLPTEFRLYEPPGNLIGVELGSYVPHENMALVSVANSKGEVMSIDTMMISFKDAHKFSYPSTSKYNAYGDVISSQSRWSNGSIHYKEYEYKYDSQGNWVEQRAYEVTHKKNGKKKRDLKSLFRRDMTYWKG